MIQKNKLPKKKHIKVTTGSFTSCFLIKNIIHRGEILKFKHKPVLLDECIQGLDIKPDGVYVDGTLRWCWT